MEGSTLHQELSQSCTSISRAETGIPEKLPSRVSGLNPDNNDIKVALHHPSQAQVDNPPDRFVQHTSAGQSAVPEVLNQPPNSAFQQHSAEQDKSDSDLEQFLSQTKADLIAKGFIPLERGIHSPEAVKTYEEVFKAPESTLKILKEGYTPHWANGEPPPIHLDNNLSAKKHMSFARDQVAQWLQLGYIHKTDVAPTIISPLSVASKTDVLSGTSFFIYRIKK